VKAGKTSINFFREDVQENRRIFKRFFRALVERGTRFLWIDEVSFNP